MATADNWGDNDNVSNTSLSPPLPKPPPYYITPQLPLLVSSLTLTLIIDLLLTLTLITLLTRLF